MPSLIVRLPLPERFGNPKRGFVASPTPSPQLPLRPTRSTRTPVSTYNLLTLTGTTDHRRTKYLKRYRVDVVHGPLPTEGSTSSWNALSDTIFKAASLPSQLGARTVQLQRSEEGEICETTDLFKTRTEEALFAIDVSPSAIVLDTSLTAGMAYLDGLDALPEVEKKEKMEKRKRKLDALNYYKLEMRYSMDDALNDRKKKYEVLNKHKAKINIEMKACWADFTVTFLSYLDNFDSPHFPETTTLDAIEEAFLQITPFLPEILIGQDHIDHFPIAVAAWLTYRRIILSVQTSHNTPLLPSQILSPFTTKIKNSRLITALKKAHLDYLSTETGDLRMYETLADGFVALQETFEEKRKIGQRVQERLGRLEGKLIELGDELGEGAGYWIAY